MSLNSASDFWTKLNEEESFRLKFLALSPGKTAEFLKSEGFEFNASDLASVVSMRMKFGKEKSSAKEEKTAQKDCANAEETPNSLKTQADASKKISFFFKHF